MAAKLYPEYGCHVELSADEEADDCVLSYGAPGDCIHAIHRRVPHTCKYWRKRRTEPPVVYLREVDAGTPNACWIVCAKGDPGFVEFVPRLSPPLVTNMKEETGG